MAVKSHLNFLLRGSIILTIFSVLFERENQIFYDYQGYRQRRIVCIGTELEK